MGNTRTASNAEAAAQSSKLQASIAAELADERRANERLRKQLAQLQAAGKSNTGPADDDADMDDEDAEAERDARIEKLTKHIKGLEEFFGESSETYRAARAELDGLLRARREDKPLKVQLMRLDRQIEKQKAKTERLDEQLDAARGRLAEAQSEVAELENDLADSKKVQATLDEERKAVLLREAQSLREETSAAAQPPPAAPAAQPVSDDRAWEHVVGAIQRQATLPGVTAELASQMAGAVELLRTLCAAAGAAGSGGGQPPQPSPQQHQQHHQPTAQPATPPAVPPAPLQLVQPQPAPTVGDNIAELPNKLAPHGGGSAPVKPREPSDVRCRSRSAERRKAEAAAAKARMAAAAAATPVGDDAGAGTKAEGGQGGGNVGSSAEEGVGVGHASSGSDPVAPSAAGETAEGAGQEVDIDGESDSVAFSCDELFCDAEEDEVMDFDKREDETEQERRKRIDLAYRQKVARRLANRSKDDKGKKPKNLRAIRGQLKKST